MYCIAECSPLNKFYIKKKPVENHKIQKSFITNYSKKIRETNNFLLNKLYCKKTLALALTT